MGGQRRIRAVFCRGGTSRGVLFRGSDLPKDRAARDRIFLHVLGSPDPYGRQLDGMGAGISSLSKVVIVEPSSREDADVDYTFVQVAVKEPVVDYGTMCGNMSSAVGPFAVDEGMVKADDGIATVRVFNTNTGKHYTARFPVKGGRAVEEGDFEIPGVAGTGARIRLDYADPGGGASGALLPTGQPRDVLEVADIGRFEVSMVDVSNPVVFVRAAEFGRSATEGPEQLERDADLMDRLDRVRRAASVAMGLSWTPGEAMLSVPRVVMIAPPSDFTALDGRHYAATDYHVATRSVSMGNIHRAIMLSGAMCVAVAGNISGTIVNELAVPAGTTLVGTPSGLVPAEAETRRRGDRWEAISATTYRTQRRIMEGAVLVPAALVGGAT
ncbi:2-methylaconitate cis-trans isomerase PrpF family protein [Tropicimonas sp. IMCC6043]|uniref:2-methylaconitate cis-trans isomerase PrpF family protein n=1 Tax=Tropicimonas sp. IMCC6043 TaxID=2510645 RepID=UPI001A92CF99|nr:PrpF domain-containing protein [Tropicimonas sp. IMCC6043]